MKKYFIIYDILIVILSLFIVLDTFVIPKEGVKVNSSNSSSLGDGEYSDTSYKDDNIEIEISTIRVNDTDVYFADIKLSSINYLKRAFANSTYGKNITQKTSEIASEVNAILAINGDYYGFRNNGFVLANGTIYRSTSNSNEALLIYNDGRFEVVNEDDTNLELINDLYQAFSFGPALIDNSKISVSKGEEVGQAMNSNPRTAIGIIDNLHYVFVVSDGRTSESVGLSLYELAEVMEDLGCEIAYNLDGGGSSTMVFNGEIINNPAGGRNNNSERSVSDIVYIGY